MRQTTKKIKLNGKEYPLIFNMNVIADIQEKYGSIDKWEEAIGNASIKDLLWTIVAFINEAIDFEFEENGIEIDKLTERQVGRYLTIETMDDFKNSIYETVTDGVGEPDPNE